jgi:hypothetical protein
MPNRSWQARPHIEMLVAATGRERTESQYAKLLSRSGFQHTRTVEAVGPASIVEAVAVQLIGRTRRYAVGRNDPRRT